MYDSNTAHYSQQHGQQPGRFPSQQPQYQQQQQHQHQYHHQHQLQPQTGLSNFNAQKQSQPMGAYTQSYGASQQLAYASFNHGGGGGVNTQSPPPPAVGYYDYQQQPQLNFQQQQHVTNNNSFQMLGLRGGNNVHLNSLGGMNLNSGGQQQTSQFHQRNDEDSPLLYTNLCVSKVPSYMTDSELEAAFAGLFISQGPNYSEDVIVSAKVMRDVSTGASKGYGFVLFRHPCDAEVAKGCPPTVPITDVNKLVRRKMRKGIPEDKAWASVRVNGQVPTLQLAVQVARHSGHNAGGGGDGGEAAAQSQSDKVYIGNIPFYVPPAAVKSFFGELATQVAARRPGIDPSIISISVRNDDPSNVDHHEGGGRGRGGRGRGGRGGNLIRKGANATEVGASKETHQVYFNTLWDLSTSIPLEFLDRARKSTGATGADPFIQSARYFDALSATSSNSFGGRGGHSAPFATPPPYMMFIDFKEPKVAQDAIIKVHGKQPFSVAFDGYQHFTDLGPNVNASPLFSYLIDVSHGEGLFPLVEHPDTPDVGRIIMLPRLDRWLRVPSFLKFASVSGRGGLGRAHEEPSLLSPDYGESSSDDDDEDGQQMPSQWHHRSLGGLQPTQKIGVPPLFVKSAENKERRDERMKLGVNINNTGGQLLMKQAGGRAPIVVPRQGPAFPDGHGLANNLPPFGSGQQSAPSYGHSHDSQRMAAPQQPSYSAPVKDSPDESPRLLSVAVADAEAMRGAAAHNHSYFRRQDAFHQPRNSITPTVNVSSPSNSTATPQLGNNSSARTADSATPTLIARTSALPLPPNYINYRPATEHALTTVIDNTLVPLRIITTIVDNEPEEDEEVNTNTTSVIMSNGVSATATAVPHIIERQVGATSTFPTSSSAPAVGGNSPPLSATQQAFMSGAAMSAVSIEGANFSLQTDIHTPPVVNMFFAGKGGNTSTSSPLQLAIPVPYSKRRPEDESVVTSGRTTTGTGTNNNNTFTNSSSQRSCGVNAGSFASATSSSNSLISMLQRQTAQLVVEHSASTGLQTFYFLCPFTQQRVVIGSVESPLSAYVTFDRLEGRCRRTVVREKENELLALKAEYRSFQVEYGLAKGAPAEDDGNPMSDAGCSIDVVNFGTMDGSDSKTLNNAFGYTIIDTTGPLPNIPLNATVPAGLARRPQHAVTVSNGSGRYETESTSTIPPPHTRPATATAIGPHHDPLLSSDEELISPGAAKGFNTTTSYSDAGASRHKVGGDHDDDLRSTSFRSTGGGIGAVGVFDALHPHYQPNSSPLIKLINSEEPMGGSPAGNTGLPVYAAVPQHTLLSSAIHSGTATTAPPVGSVTTVVQKPASKGSFIVSSGSMEPNDALGASSSSAIFGTIGQPSQQSHTAATMATAQSPFAAVHQLPNQQQPIGHPLLAGPSMAGPPTHYLGSSSLVPTTNGLPTMIPQFTMTGTPPFGVMSGSASRAHPSPNHSGQWNHISTMNNGNGGFGSYNVTPGRSSDAEALQALLYSQQQQQQQGGNASPMGALGVSTNSNFIGGNFSTSGNAGGYSINGSAPAAIPHFIGARLPQMHAVIGNTTSNPLNGHSTFLVGGTSQQQGQQQMASMASGGPMAMTSSISSAAAQPSHSPNLGQQMFSASKSAADGVGMSGPYPQAPFYQPQPMVQYPFQQHLPAPQLPDSSWASGLVDASSMSGVAAGSMSPPPLGTHVQQQQQPPYTQYVMPDTFS